MTNLEWVTAKVDAKTSADTVSRVQAAINKKVVQPPDESIDKDFDPDKQNYFTWNSNSIFHAATAAMGVLCCDLGFCMDVTNSQQIKATAALNGYLEHAARPIGRIASRSNESESSDILGLIRAALEGKKFTVPKKETA